VTPKESLMHVQGKHRREERGKERQTYIVSSNNTVHKLHNPQRHQERHEHIHQLDPLRRVLHVSIPDVGHNILRLSYNALASTRA